MQEEMKKWEDKDSPVGKWLDSINMGQYTEVFFKNGFDQLENVGNITEEDLKQMKVALGHIKIILSSSKHVNYIGKIISIRGIQWQLFLRAVPVHKNHDHGELSSEDKIENLSKWKVIELPHGKIALENIQEKGFYLSLPNKDNEDAKIINHIKDWETLEFDHFPNDASKLVIKCQSNATYLAIGKPKFIGHNPVHVVFNCKDECKVEIDVLN